MKKHEAIIMLRRKGIKAQIVDGKIKFRKRDISPIQTMYDREYLTIAQFSGAQELYRCFVDGFGENSSCEIHERVDGGGKEREMTTKQVNAIQKYRRGVKAAAKEWHLINDVVINEKSATNKNTNGYRKQQILYRLRRTLDNIAREYGFM